MEYIEANALGFTRFVKQTIPLRFFQRCRNCVFVERFQFGHGYRTAHGVTRPTLVGRAACTPLYIFALTLQRFNVFTISFLLQPPPDPAKRIIKLIYDALLQWN